MEAFYFSSPVWLQNLMVSAVGYRLYRKRYTGIYHQLRELVRVSREWNSEQREAYQAEQLHYLIRYCRLSIPYYQKLFAEYGLSDQDFTQVSDLAKLPILEKQTVRERGDEFRAPNGKPFMVQYTSGSTGTPLALHVDERTYKLAMALLVDHEEYHGVPFGARRATFAGRMIQKPEKLSPPFARLNRAENQRLYSSYHLNDQTFEHYRKDLDRFQPLELIGYPSAISDLATYYESSGTKPGFQPKAVITNSETLLDWQRSRIELVFQCPVFDYYGTAEYVLFAGQDDRGIYQINPIIGITELENEADAEGAGEIIATTLTNTSMPLLRYQVGDHGVLATNDQSSNVAISGLDSIIGRLDDYVVTPDGRRLGRMDHIFKGLEGIREAQIVQDGANHCTLKIVPQNSSTRVGEQLIESNFLSRTGREMAVSIEYVGAIPRGKNGKFKGVISLLDGPNGY
ncbi:phenylacetate--CoA ligase family protein [Marinobacter flavimaris]|jgi:phenylacetate-CoA ligase|uniref:Phenylacetate--CoA ligase family protein n=1 Tax=Marinobacter flavimaris TaxID=262076 RepID=A0A3D8H7S2_9GAMM|nr:phenylacetate--CoA ligase family protein [Marinobacter flavimaris]PPI79370.1 hypothetical protein MDHKLMBL_14500 [Marinobacter flavimaris]RDU42782.1 phenylacetate--CoA ligase family protein [Marinobacter flavimaris]